MATATATRKKKAARRVDVKKTVNNINETLINTTEELIDNTVITGEKYQKLFSKSLKKSQPIIEKQVDMAFDTLESIKDQYEFGTVRFKKLIGWNDKKAVKFRKDATKRFNSWRKKAEDVVESVQEDLSVVNKIVPAPSKTSKATVVKMNDLKVIDGIGPKLEKVLKTGGITTINALSKTNVTKLNKLVEKAGPRFRNVNPTKWINEAKSIIK